MGHPVTGERAAALARISARRRREFHKQRVAAAAGGRDRLWTAAGWVVSEAVQLPRAGREEVVATLIAIAADLNGRYEDDRA